MAYQVIQIHPQAPAKPALGAPCNGCGVCCLAEPCPVGMVLSRRRQGACSVLQWLPDESRYVCGALSNSRQTLGWFGRLPGVNRWVSRWIAAGIGCDASLEIEPPSGPPRAG